MPQFLDFDYYAKAAAEKSTLVNNAYLPNTVNLGQWMNYSKTILTDHFKFTKLQLTRENFENFENFSPQTITMLLEGISSKTDMLESFSSDNHENHQGDYLEEEDEVIPSSFQESDDSALFCLDRELIKRCVYQTDKNDMKMKLATEESIHEVFFPIPEEEGHQLFEEPIMCNQFSKALEKILVHRVFLKRMEVYPVEDPLLKPDGQVWSETYFFSDDQEPIPAETVVDIASPYEVFHTLTSKKVYMESFMLPALRENDMMLCAKSIDSLNSLMDKLDCQPVVFEANDTSEISIEIFSSGKESIELPSSQEFTRNLTENIKPPLEFFEDTSYDVQRIESVAEGRRSPVFGLQGIKFSQRLDDIELEFHSSLKNMLQPFQIRDIMDQCSFLTDKGFEKLQMEVWELEKHFEEERLLEPILSQEKLADAVEKAKALFILTPEEDYLPWKKDENAFPVYQQLNCLTDPSAKVSAIDYDYEILRLAAVEEFGKLHLAFQDMSNEGRVENFSEAHSFQKENCDEESRNPNITTNDEPPLSFEEDDHLDSFMQFRSCSLSSTNSSKPRSVFGTKMKDYRDVKDKKNMTSNVDDSSNYTEQSSALMRKEILEVKFTDPYQEPVKYMLDLVTPYFNKLKQRGLFPYQQSFFATSPDTLRFLLKEKAHENKNQQALKQYELSADNVNLTNSLEMLLNVRQAMHILIHCSLESAISHITSFEPSVQKDNGLEYLKEQLLQCQLKFQCEDIVHPKFEALLHLLKPDQQTLILVPNGLSSLALAVEAVLKEKTSFQVLVVETLETFKKECLNSTKILVCFETTLEKLSLELCDQIIEYHASNSSFVKNFCGEAGKNYVGLFSDFDDQVFTSQLVPISDKKSLKMKPSIPVIASVEMMQHQQLICTLENKCNLRFLERNFSTLCPYCLYYPDVIFSLEVCLVLLPLLEVGSSDWDKQAFIKRVIAVGLQVLHCFILVHGIGASSRYLLDKTALQNIYHLQASLSNISNSSTSFTTQYKILVAMTQEDVAMNVEAITQYSQTLSSFAKDAARPWLQKDISQDEAFLLQLVCLNSFSAQLLLSKFSIGEILMNNPKEIKNKFPYFPDNILMYFKKVICKLKSDQFSSSSNSSPVSNRSISQKSASSSTSYVISEPQHLHLSPLPPFNQPAESDLSLSTSAQTMNCPVEKMLTSQVQITPRMSSDLGKRNSILYRYNKKSSTESLHLNEMSSMESSKSLEVVKEIILPNSVFSENNFRVKEEYEPVTTNQKSKNLFQSNYQPPLHQVYAVRDDNFFNQNKDVPHIHRGEKISETSIPSVEKQKQTLFIQCGQPMTTDPSMEEEMAPFFIGKSQSSPQQDIKAEMDDPVEDVFFLGKSQGSPTQYDIHGDYSQFKPHHNAYETKTSGLSSLYDNNTYRNDISYEMEGFTVSQDLAHSYRHPMSSSLTNSEVSKPAGKEQPLVHKRGICHPVTPGSSYGVFSAKVRRQGDPELSKIIDFENSTSYPSDTETGYEFKRDRMIESICETGGSLISEITKGIEPQMSNESPSASIDAPLPFAVSRDLKRHIRQTSSNILAHDQRLKKGNFDGILYGERISRMPFVLRKECETPATRPHIHFECKKFSSESNESVSNQQSHFHQNDNGFRNEYLQTPDLSTSIQNHPLINHSFQNFNKSCEIAKTCFNQSTNSACSQHALDKCLTSSFHSSANPEEIRVTDPSKTSSSYRSLSLGSHPHFVDKMQQQQNLSLPQSSCELRSKNYGPVMHYAESNKKSIETFGASRGVCSLNENDSFIISSDYSNDSREKFTAHSLLDLNRPHDVATLPQKPYKKKSRPVSHVNKGDCEEQEKQRNVQNELRNNLIASNRVLQNQDNHSGAAPMQSADNHCYDSQTGARLHDFAFKKHLLNNHYDRSFLHPSTVSDGRGDYEKLSSFPSSDGRRLYNLPYTPRRHVSVGLAQPLKRNAAADQGKNGYRQVADKEHFPPSRTLESADTQPSLPANYTAPSSPPMDLDNNDNHNGELDCTNERPTTYYANKMRRWNDHFQRHAANFQSTTSQRNNWQQTKNRTTSPQRKKLCLEKGDRHNGQMKLAFK